MYGINHIVRGEFKPNTQVLVRIAELFLENNSIKKTHLHFASRTDWNSFERYLNWLQNKNYIECSDENKHMYRLTNRGREVINAVMMLRDDIKKLQLLISV